MRETRLSGSEGGAGSIPVSTPIVAWAFQPMSGRQRIAGRVELRTRSGGGGGRRAEQADLDQEHPLAR